MKTRRKSWRNLSSDFCRNFGWNNWKNHAIIWSNSCRFLWNNLWINVWLNFCKKKPIWIPLQLHIPIKILELFFGESMEYLMKESQEEFLRHLWKTLWEDPWKEILGEISEEISGGISWTVLGKNSDAPTVGMTK